MNNSLHAISPLDGRYSSQTVELSEYFSEFALIKNRVRIEIDYFIALSNIGLPELSPFDFCTLDKLRNIYLNFNDNDALRIKKIEGNIKHDVKAVEIFLREKIGKIKIKSKNYVEFIHFGLTSQDINTTANIISIKSFIENIYIINIKSILDILKTYSDNWKNIIILSHTHGQPAVPSTMGKEMMIFFYRIERQVSLLMSSNYYSKFGGAVGNFNAHLIAYPNIDWNKFADNFLSKYNLKRNVYTTQIDNYENLSAIFDNLKRINSVLVDMCRDIWCYISMNYFTQLFEANQVGSSTMPHKINPIDFENCEGNLLLANALLEFMSRKLPISRLQRDLTDSTVLRNVGVLFGHTIVAYKNLIKGLHKLKINQEAIHCDIVNNLSIMSEAIQTILRKYGCTGAYDIVKNFFRTNNKATTRIIFKFINDLDIDPHIKNELHKITMDKYCGYANKNISQTE